MRPPFLYAVDPMEESARWLTHKTTKPKGLSAMAKKTPLHKRSNVRKASKHKTSVITSWIYRSRTKIVLAVIASALLATASLAFWKTPDNEVIAPAPVTSETANKSPVKDLSTLSEKELADIPPEAFHPQPPKPAGYNAHSGTLPPDAVPPGVVLPGMTTTQGGRTTAQGYGMNDGVRQQFTQKERDNETGLDYFGARYYSSAQGRFTSVDPVIDFKKNISEPQGWNQYQYVLNNPLRYVDPNGQEPQDSFELNQNRDIKALLNHQITEKEYWDRQNARAAGAAIGAVVVGAVLAGREIGAAVLLWAATNPDKVVQIASVLQESAGGPPGMISGVGTASKAEWSIAQKLAAEGKDVEIVAAQGASRTADFVVSGVKTELKTLEGVGGVATSGTVKSAIGRGLGQSGNVIVDARGVKLTLEAAQKGAARAFGADKRLQVVRIIGKDYDFTIARHQ